MGRIKPYLCKTCGETDSDMFRKKQSKSICNDCKKKSLRKGIIIKPYLCEVCGEIDSNKFSVPRKSKCKSCVNESKRKKDYCVYKCSSELVKGVYIGSTCNFKRRLIEHKARYKTNDCDKLYEAFNDYGFNNFNFEIIEENISKSNLTIREQHYIDLYDSVNNGFNQTNAYSSIETKKQNKHNHYMKNRDRYINNNKIRASTPENKLKKKEYDRLRRLKLKSDNK